MSEDATPSLPNLWRIYNLRESPYFQETLGSDSHRYPLSLFVGRAAEARRLLTAIGSSASSRQAVGGAPGVGKTTLVQSVKAAAFDAGYWTTDRLVPFSPDDTAGAVLGRLLAGLYDTILTARPMTISNTAMQAAQQLVRVARLESGGVSLSFMGVGAGMTRGASAATPPDAIMVDGPRVIRDLLRLVRQSGAPGVVLHLNNLENLGERDAKHAAEILRGLRDTVLLQEGLHIILAGTSDVVATVTGTFAQVRSVFATPIALGPLAAGDVQELLDARYEHLRLAPRKPVIPPVAPAAVKALYPLFRGDLRSLFKVLEEGASLLMGVVQDPGKSIPLSELRPALRQRYAGIISQLEPRRQRQLRAWAVKGLKTEHTQKSLAALWNISQPAVSVALRTLEQDGLVVSLPRRGSDATRYALSGVSRMVFG